MVNTLRLWSAKATRAFNLEVFNAGDYVEAVRNQTFAEKISMVLYPEDSTPQGKELRLQQQYFFVACSLKDFVDQVLPKFMERRYPRVKMVLDNSLQLAEWEIHPDTPGADPGRIMGETLHALCAPA